MERVYLLSRKATEFSLPARSLGGHAEYALAADHTVYTLPEKLDLKQGAAVGILYVTAYRALLPSAHVKAGESVLVHGASGGIGIAACQIARAYGLKVWAQLVLRKDKRLFCKMEPMKCLITKELITLIKLRNLLVKKELI